MLITIFNTLRATPFWALLSLTLAAFAAFVPEYSLACGLMLIVSLYGWHQKFRIYRSLRARFKSQGSFRADSYESYYRTWCERMALYQAARESGHYEAAYYHGRHVLGYTLLHIFPRHAP